MGKEKTGGLWKNDSSTPEGKYLVKRRDGSIPEWPWFVIGAKDPCAPAALRAYADKAEKLGLDSKYVADVRVLALEFEEFLADYGKGDPDGKPHRTDDPVIIKEMRLGHSS